MTTGQNNKEIPDIESGAENQTAPDFAHESGPIYMRLGRKWFVGIYCLAAVLLALSLFFGLRLLMAPEKFPSEADSGNAVVNNAASTADVSHPRPLVKAGSIPFEESLGAPLEETVKRLDHIIIQSLAEAQFDPRTLSLVDVEERKDNGHSYLFQVIQIPLSRDSEPLFQYLARRIGGLQSNATLERMRDTAWQVAVAGNPTHHLLFLPPEGKATPPVQEGRGRLTIVIDDLGESVDFARQLADLDIPVSFAVWPRSSSAVEVAETAHAAGLEVLVHQPMEPEAYPEVNPGPGAVFIDMDTQAIREIVGGNLEMVPYAVGMNNHMGSAFTQDSGSILAVIRELRSRNMFILDSLTHPDSKVLAEAKRLGLRAFRRDVFLDVVRDVEAIAFQLDKSQQLALHRGQAVAIGHPYPETLEALKLWSQRKDRRLDVVSLLELSPQNGIAVANSGAVSASKNAEAY